MNLSPKTFFFSSLLILLPQTAHSADSILAAHIEQLKWESLLEAYGSSLKVIDLEKKSFKVNNGGPYTFDAHPGFRTYAQLFESPDLQDTFLHLYPLHCSSAWIPSKDFDPGRFRNESFLKDLYGHTENEIESHIITQPWLNGQNIRVMNLEGVAKRFARIADNFESSPLDVFLKYLWPSEGAFNFRKIAGTTLLSSHSFGTAIDVNLKFSNYWKWDEPNPNAPFHYKNSIPCEVVAIFESEGFVSGTKWYHYDTMHFEYHPEIIIFAKKIRAEFGENLEQLKDLSNLVLPQ